MTDHAFDDLAKRLSAATTRRGVLKGALALALGGVASRLRGGDAEASARQACMRLHQTCDASHHCCAHLACQGGACCRPYNETCYADSDCCADNVCRPNPHGMGQRCLPPGGLRTACVDEADCQGNLTCDPQSGTCLAITGEPCAANSDCVSGVCDDYSGTCAGSCFGDGATCLDSNDCCSTYCDPYTLTCTNFCTGDTGSCGANGECCSGICDDVTGQCIGTCLATDSACGESADCCTGVCDPYTGTCIDCLSDSNICLSVGKVCLSNGSCALPCPNGGSDCGNCGGLRCISTSDGPVCSVDNAFGSCNNSNADCPAGTACSGAFCEHLC